MIAHANLVHVVVECPLIDEQKDEFYLHLNLLRGGSNTIHMVPSKKTVSINNDAPSEII